MKIKRPFTLVELLTAMAILVILTGIMFQFIVGAQRAWTASSANARIYENARIAMELLSRDLRTAQVSDDSGREIPFCTGHAADNIHVATVSVSDPLLPAAESRLCEISYKHETTGAEKYILKRQSICDQDAEWNFYGQTDKSWVTDNTGSFGDHRDFHDLIDGVESFTMTFYANPNMAADTAYNRLPSVVAVSMTLFDPRLMTEWDNLSNERQDQERRTFSKMIFLGSAQ